MRFYLAYYFNEGKNTKPPYPACWQFITTFTKKKRDLEGQQARLENPPRSQKSVSVINIQKSIL
jgi:hypothetical protein